MSTRISKPLQCLGVLLSLPLAACGREQPADTAVAAQRQATPADEARIACARGNAALAASCTVEQAQGRDGLILTVRHPDGGFRRLLVTQDGRGVIAADGAEVARVSVLGADGIEVALGGDRYRLPATIKGAAKPS